nr:unnamed protein product [Fasciola hepatica]
MQRNGPEYIVQANAIDFYVQICVGCASGEIGCRHLHYAKSLRRVAVQSQVETKQQQPLARSLHPVAEEDRHLWPIPRRKPILKADRIILQMAGGVPEDYTYYFVRS